MSYQNATNRHDLDQQIRESRIVLGRLNDHYEEVLATRGNGSHAALYIRQEIESLEVHLRRLRRAYKQALAESKQEG